MLKEELEVPNFCYHNEKSEHNTDRNMEHALRCFEEEIVGGLIMCEEKKNVTKNEKFEVPEKDTRGNCNEGTCFPGPETGGNCRQCCDNLTPEKRERFGVPCDAKLFCDCHDICVPEVRYICAKEVDCYIKVPGIAGRRSGCRGEREVEDLNGPCRLIVTCADERLRQDCRAVILRVGIQIVFGDLPRNTRLILDRVLEFTCYEFYPFPGDEPHRPISGRRLRRALREIDGSCVVVDLECHVDDDGPHDGEPKVHITGTIVDKLWKKENILVTGLRPYEGITVCHEFEEPHKIGDCASEDDECPFARNDD